MLFCEYLKEQTKDTCKLYYNFYGISRKEFPKWPGWKIINQYKKDNVNIKEIEDNILNMLVRNFYYLQFMQEFEQEFEQEF